MNGIALAQTAEGAMDEMVTMLQRVRTLAVQSSNGTNSTADRQAMQQEVSQLSHEITRIACQTKFGGELILAGNSATPGQNGTAQGKGRGLISSEGTITVQAGAYSGDTLTLTGFSSGFTISAIASLSGKTTGIVDTGVNTDGLLKSGDYAVFSVSDQTGAGNVITTVDDMIKTIDKQRAHLGAMQNRMESTIRNQSNISMNVSDARSRIRDTDFAEESAKLSQQSIIQQAASSMLTQANARPQIALSMLG